MKNIILILYLVSPFFLSCQEINKKNTKVKFEVSGNCIMCKKRIEKAVLSSKGVKYALWDIPSNQLTLIYDSRNSNLEKIHKLILNAGHDTSLFPASDDVYNELPLCCLYERKINYDKEKNLQ
tara:strand:+ start:14 stop:382 length:369 start_codon:yes stop_codon:yes gene_type:complete